MRLDNRLRERDCDGYLDVDDGQGSLDTYYLSGFRSSTANRGYAVLRVPGRTALLPFTEVDVELAREEADVDVVRSRSDYDFGQLRAERGFQEAYVATFAAFLDDFGVETVGVPEDFPYFFGSQLAASGYGVEPMWGAVRADRSVKSQTEIDHVRTAQRANEAAMAVGEKLLADADVVDGTLHHEGDPLTAERIRTEMKIELLRHDCTHPSVPTVAHGPRGSERGWDGDGQIEAGDPVLIDMSPRHESGYYGDLSRTFVRGTPDDRLVDMYETTERAQRSALEVLEDGAGVTGDAVHRAACEVFEDAGFTTASGGETDPDADYPFTATGHGVGLSENEYPPQVSEGAGPLEAGNVITVEPGLYDPAVGGVRLEDLVVVTEDGYENLTTYEKSLLAGS